MKLLFRLPVFKGISVPLLREIAAIMERRTYRLGSFIFRQGENANSMFVLASGSVRIVRQMHVSEHIARMQQTVCTCSCCLCVLQRCVPVRISGRMMLLIVSLSQLYFDASCHGSTGQSNLQQRI